MSVTAKQRIEANLSGSAVIDQIARFEDGTTDEFDAVTPAWDGEVNKRDDFDAVTDGDTDMNDHADAAHDGAVGLKYTFDDNNVMYGTMDAGAVDRTTGVISFWFNMELITMTDPSYIYLLYCMDGAANINWRIRFYESGAFNLVYREDGGGSSASGNSSLIPTGWHKIDLHFVRSTGAGDGTMRLYIDDVLEIEVDDIDNDTLDWDYARIGMIATTSVAFAGSFYIDTIKIDPVGAPAADKLSAKNGTYGMTIPIMDTTARYVEFTDPVAEPLVTAECWFDPNTLAMASGNNFYAMVTEGFLLRFRYTAADGYNFFITELGDLANTSTGYHNITDAPHHIRVVWKASSEVAADDGYVSLYIDNVLMETLSGLNNDTKTIANVYFGAQAGIDAGTYGIFYVDDCRWGPWADITSDVIGDITGGWGNADNDPTDFLADTGVMNLVLNNSAAIYIPGLTTSLAGWDKGTPVRLSITYSGSRYVRFYGTIDDIDPDVKGYPGSEGDRVYVTITDWMDYAATHPMISPAIDTTQRGDEMMTTILADMPIQPLSTDFETGINTFETAFDTVTMKTKAYSEMTKIGVSELAPIYLIKDSIYGETLIVENAYTRNGLRVPDATFDNSMKGIDVKYGHNVINRFIDKVNPRYIEAGISVLFALGAPIVIGSGETITVRGNYTDPSGGQAAVGANMIAAVATTDYTMNTLETGAGVDKTADLTVTESYKPAWVDYELTNGAGLACWITKLQARGYLVYKYNQLEITVEDSDSQDEFGIIEKRIDQKYQQETFRGYQYTAGILDREKQPRTKLNGAHFIANRSNALMLAWLTRDVGDLVYIKEDKVEIDTYAYILGVQFSISPGGVMKFAWILSAVLIAACGLTPISTEFDIGSTDIMDFGYLPQVTKNAATTRSISTWVYMKDHTNLILSIAVATGWSDEAGTYVGIENDGDGIPTISVTYYQKGIVSAGVWWTGVDTVPFDAWTHILCTRDASVIANKPKIYIDGVLQVGLGEIVQGGVTGAETGGHTFLGNYKTATIDRAVPLGGIGKNTRIYDVILTQAEATSLAAEGDVTRGMVFQTPYVRTKELVDFEDLVLTDEKLIDNMYGAIGTPSGSPTTRLIP